MTNTSNALLPGWNLSNGATVIQHNLKHNKVLAYRSNGDGEFVVWSIDPETRDTYWGHYFPGEHGESDAFEFYAKSIDDRRAPRLRTVA